MYSGRCEDAVRLLRAQKDPVMCTAQTLTALGFLLTGGPAAAVQMMKRITEHYA